jgi:ketosteroid isomerase-like protein
MKTTPDVARRRFLWNAGAALSVPVALATAGPAEGAAEDGASLEARLAMLEDVNAIRELHYAYAKHVSAGAHDAVASLFADSGQARLDAGIRALAADPLGEPDAIEIAADRMSATARLHCTVTIETAIEPTCPLVEMARAQGGGTAKRSERGVLANVYVKRDGRWKIERSSFRAV